MRSTLARLARGLKPTRLTRKSAFEADGLTASELSTIGKQLHAKPQHDGSLRFSEGRLDPRASGLHGTPISCWVSTHEAAAGLAVSIRFRESAGYFCMEAIYLASGVGLIVTAAFSRFAVLFVLGTLGLAFLIVGVLSALLRERAFAQSAHDTEKSLRRKLAMGADRQH